MTFDIVWFKRDLRLSDHAPLMYAIENGNPLLLIYFFEPAIINAPQSDSRHWRFVYQSIVELNKELSKYNSKVVIVYDEVAPTLLSLFEKHNIENIYSYQEIGLQITYDRDKEVAELCKEYNINWQEFPYAGVSRGLSNRKYWRKNWYSTMSQPLDQPELDQLKPLVELEKVKDSIETQSVPQEFTLDDKSFQKGGRSWAERYLQTFLNDRASNYNKHISRPEASRKSCSRLSPYLAWGNLSMREVYQAMKKKKETVKYKRPLSSFGSRLRWHCHFIQKFESEIRYEIENINRGYDKIRNEVDKEKLEAWKNGQTGYPLVDACMRCVKSTGYINFRMRAMVVSFLTHHLWQHWKEGADYLAAQFLDFEPGIHYTQFQMQAGTTGINTIRIYNPVKQAKDNDEDGTFVKKWVPELSDLPIKFIIEPWEMTEADQQMYGVFLGDTYPERIVDIKATYKSATSTLYKMKGDKEVRAEGQRILKRHTVAKRRV